MGEGQTWELTLPVPLATEFRLRGRRVYPIDDQQAVSLLALPQAESQRGTLILATLGPQRRVANFQRKLFAVPETEDELTVAGHVGTYRYEPVRDVLTVEPTVVTISRTDEPTGKVAWASAGELRSRYAALGESLHQAVYWIEQTGEHLVNVSLPENATLQRILLDGVPVTARTAGADSQDVTVQLPPRAGRTTLLVDFSLSMTPLRFYDRITAQSPRLSLPVLRQQWKIWLPRGQLVWDREQEKQHDGFHHAAARPLGTENHTSVRAFSSESAYSRTRCRPTRIRHRGDARSPRS